MLSDFDAIIYVEGFPMLLKISFSESGLCAHCAELGAETFEVDLAAGEVHEFSDGTGKAVYVRLLSDVPGYVGNCLEVDVVYGGPTDVLSVPPSPAISH